MSYPTNVFTSSKHISTEPLHRRKRRRISESPVSKQRLSTNHEILGLIRQETRSQNKGDLNLEGSSCNSHHIHGYGQNNLMPKLQQFNQHSNLVNYDQRKRRIISKTRRNFRDDDEAASFDQSFTKINDTLSRIESVIPALQQLACSNPINHDTGVDVGVGVSTLPSRSRLNPRPHLTNMSRIESINPTLQQLACSNLINHDTGVDVGVGVSTLPSRSRLNPHPHLTNMSRIESIIPALQQSACSNPINHDMGVGVGVGVSTMPSRSGWNPRPHLTNMSRIESIIPALQQLACSNPINHDTGVDVGVGVSTLPSRSRLNHRPRLTLAAAKMILQKR